MHDYYLSQITKRLDGNDVAFMNASMGIRENTWCKVVARMSENETTAELYNNNGTLLQSIATIDDAISISELGILMVYETDTVMAFKNLKVGTLDPSTPSVDENQVPAHRLGWKRGR
ncbi:MAG: hypothetical protein O2V44_05820 [Candidatus Bathyarchaeota archaeon]|nr:hypothetical protein [Candidatus Bathyarchaeota archaeon]